MGWLTLRLVWLWFRAYWQIGEEDLLPWKDFCALVGNMLGLEYKLVHVYMDSFQKKHLQKKRKKTEAWYK